MIRGKDYIIWPTKGLKKKNNNTKISIINSKNNVELNQISRGKTIIVQIEIIQKWFRPKKYIYVKITRGRKVLSTLIGFDDLRSEF